MKTKPSNIVFYFIALSFGLTNLFSSASAKTFDLYEQPTTASNIVDTMNSTSGVILIYSPKDGTWVKIANPKNGNVGWVKSSDLSSNNTTQTKLTIASADDGKEVSTIMQFGNSVKITMEQAQAMAKKLKLQQQAVHQTMQHMVNDMNKLFQEEWKLFNQSAFPVAIPVLYIPVEKNATPATQGKSAKNTVPSMPNHTTKEI